MHIDISLYICDVGLSGRRGILKNRKASYTSSLYLKTTYTSSLYLKASRLSGRRVILSVPALPYLSPAYIYIYRERESERARVCVGGVKFFQISLIVRALAS